MTITKLALCTVFFIAAAPPCNAAAPTPEEIIEAFFGPNPGPDRAASYTGEMKEHYSDEPAIGQMLPPGKHYTARLLTLPPADTPVYGVAINNRGETFDWYAYFALDNGSLKLRTMRTLGLSGLPYDFMKLLAQRAVRTGQQEWDYQNLRLSFLPDLERLDYFRNQLGELDALKTAIDAKDDAAIKRKLRALHFSGWEHNEHGQIEIWIGGGLLNSVVGVLYVPPGENPPPVRLQDDVAAAPWGR